MTKNDTFLTPFLHPNFDPQVALWSTQPQCLGPQDQPPDLWKEVKNTVSNTVFCAKKYFLAPKRYFSKCPIFRHFVFLAQNWPKMTFLGVPKMSTFTVRKWLPRRFYHFWHFGPNFDPLLAKDRGRVCGSLYIGLYKEIWRVGVTIADQAKLRAKFGVQNRISRVETIGSEVFEGPFP